MTRPRPTAYIRWDPERNEATIMPADRKAGGATTLTRAEVVARYTPAGLNLLINKHGQWLPIAPPAPAPAAEIPMAEGSGSDER